MSAIDRDRPYTSAQVAALVFGRTVQWFYAYRAGQGLLDGFPPPFSPSGHPRWSGAALLAWMQRPQRRAETPSAASQDCAGGNVTDIRVILRARSKGIAHRSLASR
jgi:hypothetical protein